MIFVISICVLFHFYIQAVLRVFQFIQLFVIHFRGNTLFKTKIKQIINLLLCAIIFSPDPFDLILVKFNFNFTCFS
ncbi:MAG TPA: hypothetical protein VF817_01600 [Patescibacteria group bacterium]